MRKVTSIASHPRFVSPEERARRAMIAEAWNKLEIKFDWSGLGRDFDDPPELPKVSPTAPVPGPHSFNPMMKRFTYHPDQSRTPHEPE